MLHRLCLLVIALAALGAAAAAQQKKPPVPVGRDPGGMAIALLGTGIDYTLPRLALRLARDGEGELIGWDVEDRDRQPFDASKGDKETTGGGDGSAIASFLLGAEGTRLVPVRVNPADPVSLARARVWDWRSGRLVSAQSERHYARKRANARHATGRKILHRRLHPKRERP